MEGEQRSAKDQKVISYLESRIRTYEKKAAQARRKVGNLDALSNRIEKQLQTYEKTVLRYNADDDDSMSSLSPLVFETIG
jgi:phosphoribosylaminoimidazole carboxylase (NCAIR synthetase)